jgi:iron complex transport system ATP-binding protein
MELELDHLHYQYKPSTGRKVIEGVSLTVRGGEIVAILGPNGAGKSTLLSIAAGVLVPQGGEVRVDGRPICSFSRREMARTIARVTQQSEIRFPMTVLEYVLTGRFPYATALGFDSPEDVALAQEALRQTDALPFADRSVMELSMGERQRVTLARALAQRPQFLLLDEPTANADLAHQISLLSCVRRTVRQLCLGALLVTHDLNLAAEFADRVLLLKEGCLIASGPPKDVMTEQGLSELFALPLMVNPHPISGDLRIFWSGSPREEGTPSR